MRLMWSFWGNENPWTLFFDGRNKLKKQNVTTWLPSRMTGRKSQLKTFIFSFSTRNPNVPRGLAGRRSDTSGLLMMMMMMMEWFLGCKWTRAPPSILHVCFGSISAFCFPSGLPAPALFRLRFINVSLFLSLFFCRVFFFFWILPAFVFFWSSVSQFEALLPVSLSSCY